MMKFYLIILLAQSLSLLPLLAGAVDEGDKTAKSQSSFDVGSLEGGKSNKISSALHFIHRVHGVTLNLSTKPKETDEKIKEFDENMSDEEVLMGVCNLMVLVSAVCRKSVLAVKKKDPSKISEIAALIKSRPENMNARKLLRHKLMEAGILTMEEKGYDEKLNTLLNLVATTNPYAATAAKVLDTSSKYIS